MTKHPGLSYPVIKRIDQLEFIAKSLEEKGDPLEVLPNVMAIRDAYRTKELDLYEGLVTNWSRGKRLSEPRPPNDDELIAISVWAKGEKGFGVEEVGR
jgi:hypothetical protein